MEVRWVPLDECVDAVLDRRIHNALARDRRARRARGARTRLADARRRGCPVAEPSAAAERRRTMTATRRSTSTCGTSPWNAGSRGTRSPSYRRDLAIYADWLARSRHRRARAPSPSSDLGDFVRFLGAEREPPLATVVDRARALGGARAAPLPRRGGRGRRPTSRASCARRSCRCGCRRRSPSSRRRGAHRGGRRRRASPRCATRRCSSCSTRPAPASPRRCR